MRDFLLSLFHMGVGVFLAGMLAVGIFQQQRSASILRKAVQLFFILICGFAISYILDYFFHHPIGDLIQNIAALAVIPMVLSGTKVYWAILFGSCTFLMMQSMGVLVSAIVYLWYGDGVEYFTKRHLFYTLLTVYFMIFLLFRLIIWAKKKVSPEKQYTSVILLMAFTVLPYVFTFLYYAVFGRMIGLNSKELILGISAMFVILCGIAVLILARSILENRLKDRQLSMAEELLAVQKEHISQMARKQSQIEQISHDFKQHVHTLMGLNDSGRYGEITTVLQQLSQQPLSNAPITTTGNALLDALLSIKQEMAERASILCQWKIAIPPQLAVHELDTCAILGNALDNAIEACQRSAAEQPFIKADMRCEEEWLLCSITNSIGQIPKVEEGLFKTLKYDADHHGIGLQSMKRCCQSMGGDLEVYYDDEVFTVRFMLPLIGGQQAVG